MLNSFPQLFLRTPLQPLNFAYKNNIAPYQLFLDGLYISSPEFWHELQKKESLKGKEKEKMELSLTKYWLRSSVRCTPYGTFAGSTLVNISNHPTSIIHEDANKHIRNVRLDMNYLTEIVSALCNIPQIREQLIFIPNNSLYRLANTYRYAEYNISNNTRTYQLTSVEQSGYIEKILQRAQQGETMKNLTLHLMQDEDVMEEEAKEYINELWHAQLLIPMLEPAVTGSEPLDQIIAQLEKLQGIDEILFKLKAIKQLLVKPESGVNYYIEVEKKLEQLGLGIKIPKNTVQVDLALKTQSNIIDAGLIKTIITQVESLKAFARDGTNPELKDFKSKYITRYEDKVMPLAIALDSDMGIGYAGINDQNSGAGAWIDGLVAAGGGGNNSVTSSRPLDYLQRFSLEKYVDYVTTQKSAIEIQEQEIEALKGQTRNNKFPNSMYLMGSIMKLDGLLNNDHFLFDISSFGGPSAANLLGRFAHRDEQLCQLTKDILAQEEIEYPDAIYAEIVHLPQARIGNVLLRPVLRNYEIPYVGLSGANKDNQITIDDLYISIQNDEIILWSKFFNKRVIPRLTTAHNFNYNSLPIYKFLCDLQSQNFTFPNVWDWGNLSLLKHLPRIVYKNLILKKAVWKIEKKEIENLPKDAKDYPLFFEAFCFHLKLPQKVVLKENDNELFIDFKEKRGIELFLHYIKRSQEIVLEEFLFTEENCIVHDKEGNPFTNEIIIPLFEGIKTEEKNEHQANKSQIVEKFNNIKTAIKRNFSPYSEWLYFKVYCGAKSAEKILATVIHPFIEKGKEQSLFEHFFFIRYNDESGGHFRIRFFNSVLEKQMPLYQKFMQEIQYLLDNNTIEKVMLDSYNREIERYTPELIEDSEKLFFNDSLATLRFINLLDGIDGDKYRMVFALRGIDLLLSDFGFTLEQKGKLAKKIQSGFFQEFGGFPILQKQLNDRYRKHQTFLISHINAENDIENETDEAAEIFRIRSEMNQEIVSRILKHVKQTGNEDKIPDLLSSYTHMYINRLYLAQQRKYELVVYHFLDRYYTSRIALEKQEKKKVLTNSSMFT